MYKVFLVFHSLFFIIFLTNCSAQFEGFSLDEAKAPKVPTSENIKIETVAGGNTPQLELSEVSNIEEYNLKLYLGTTCSGDAIEEIVTTAKSAQFESQINYDQKYAICLVAKDTSGNVIPSTSNPFIIESTRPTYYSTNFDNCTGWSVSGAAGWECGDQTDDNFGPPSGHSGNSVYGTKLNANYDYYSSSSFLDSPVVTLPETAKKPLVKFWMDLENEVPTTCGGMCDGAILWLSVNGGPFIIPEFKDPGMRGLPRQWRYVGNSGNEHSWGVTQPLGEWGEVVIDLFALTTSGLNNIKPGDTVQVRFEHYSDAGVTEAGWYIDDFSVEESDPLPLKKFPYSQNFDSVDDWYFSSSLFWEIGVQNDDSFGPPSGRSGNTVLGTLLNNHIDSGSANVSFTGSYVNSPKLSLKGSTSPKIKFWMDMETTANQDGGNIFIAVNGGDFIELDFNDEALSGLAHTNDGNIDTQNSYNGTGWSGEVPLASEWAEVTIDLLNIQTPGLQNITVNDSIEVRFSFYANHYSNSVPGWYIDDFTISD